MVKSSLSEIGHAIASDTRRAMLDRLAVGSATMSELADTAGVSLPAIDKHLSVLASAGLVSKSKSGRTTNVALCPGGLDELAVWAMRNRLMWQNALDRLADHLDDKALDHEVPDEEEKER